MSQFELSLSESELKIVLEVLIEKEVRMGAICDNSDDEDEIADVGNDLIELRLLLKPLKEKAVDKYGSDIVNFSREFFNMRDVSCEEARTGRTQALRRLKE